MNDDGVMTLLTEHGLCWDDSLFRKESKLMVVKIHILPQMTRLSESVIKKIKHYRGGESGRHDDSLLYTYSFLLIYCLLTAKVVSKSLRQPL